MKFVSIITLGFLDSWSVVHSLDVQHKQEKHVLLATHRVADEKRNHTHKKHHHKAKASRTMKNGPDTPQDTKGLEPVSNDEFFGSEHHPGDYQVDESPLPTDKERLDYPYPAYKNVAEFDRDFLEDSDSDGGAWKSQMEYDELRGKVQKTKDIESAAAEKLEKAQMEFDDTEENQARLDAAKDKNEHEWEVKEEEKENLEIRVKEKVDAANEAESQVELRTRELQEAEKELQETTARLQQAHSELEEAERGVRGLDEARKASEAAKAKLDDSRREAEEFESTVEEKAKVRDEAAELVQEKRAETTRVQAEANYARLRLAKHARGSVDKEGDVGGLYKAAATTLSIALFSWLMLI